jgi:hypothetical protein
LQYASTSKPLPHRQQWLSKEGKCRANPEVVAVKGFAQTYGRFAALFRGEAA